MVPRRNIVAGKAAQIAVALAVVGGLLIDERKRIFSLATIHVNRSLGLVPAGGQAQATGGRPRPSAGGIVVNLTLLHFRGRLLYYNEDAVPLGQRGLALPTTANNSNVYYWTTNSAAWTKASSLALEEDPSKNWLCYYGKTKILLVGCSILHDRGNTKFILHS